MTTLTVTSFVEQLRKIGLLNSAEIQQVQYITSTAQSPAALASELIQRGWLTPYQANQIARGRADELVIGSYLILSRIGQGGMGEVVKARHRFMDREVALKLLRREPKASADTVTRFQREVRLLANLQHPHIVQAYDAGSIGTIWFLAMELLEGEDLAKVVQKKGPLPIGVACSFIRQAALGLHYAHERGLVHRDIKPSNLFLTVSHSNSSAVGVIKILDLGLARSWATSDQSHSGDLTAANAMMGTPDYLAPEQAVDPRLADARSDLYSLGCTFYFLLTAQAPFPEGTLAQKILYHQQTEPKPVESFRSDVPEEVRRLLRQTLAKAKEQRPAKALEVAVQLAPFSNTTGTQIPPAQQLPVQSNGPSTESTDASNSDASLVNSPAPQPEQGFTLWTDESLITSPASAPEQGFTLVTDESVATERDASLINAPAPQPEHGFTLAVPDQSLVASSAPDAEPSSLRQATNTERSTSQTFTKSSPIVTIRSLLANLPQRLVLCVGLGAGGFLLLLLCVIGIWWLASGTQPVNNDLLTGPKKPNAKKNSTETHTTKESTCVFFLR
ncbi:MAG: serine/threonine protein kinase [Gemmataceae bacterium]